MPLFRKRGDPGREPDGSWHADPLGRFDFRLMVAPSMHAREWAENVRLGSEAHRDPLPPRFTMSWAESLDQMRMRTTQTMVRGRPKDRPKTLAEADDYFERKSGALRDLAAPNMPIERRPEWIEALCGAMTISGRDYLESFSANQTYIDGFEAIASQKSPAAHIAFFWDIDDFFRMPNFHDDLIFRGGQLLLEQIGLAERPFVGQRPG